MHSASALPAVVEALAELAMPATLTKASLAMLSLASRLRPFCGLSVPLPVAAPVTLAASAVEPKSTWPVIVPMPPMLVVPSAQHLRGCRRRRKLQSPLVSAESRLCFEPPRRGQMDARSMIPASELLMPSPLSESAINGGDLSIGVLTGSAHTTDVNVFRSGSSYIIVARTGGMARCCRSALEIQVERIINVGGIKTISRRSSCSTGVVGRSVEINLTAESLAWPIEPLNSAPSAGS